MDGTGNGLIIRNENITAIKRDRKDTLGNVSQWYIYIRSVWTGDHMILAMGSREMGKK